MITKVNQGLRGGGVIWRLLYGITCHLTISYATVSFPSPCLPNTYATEPAERHKVC